MKRKVNKVGQNTLTISLPSKWVQKYGIKQGQELDMDEQAGQLVVGLKKQIKLDRIKIHFDDSAMFTRRSIHIPYRRGYDEMEVTYSDPKVAGMIMEALGETIGFEVVDQGKKFTLVKNVAIGLDQEFDPLFNRLFMIIKTMGNNNIEALKKDNPNIYEEAKAMEETVQTFVNFCCRELYKKGYKDEMKTIPLYCIVRGLERVADNYKIQSQILNGKIYLRKTSKQPLSLPDITLKKSKELVQLHNQLMELTQLIYEMLNKFEHETLIKFKEKESKAKEDALRLILESKEKGETLFLSYTLSTLDELIHMTELLF